MSVQQKRRSVRFTKKKHKPTQRSSRRVRLAIECSPEERKYIKMVAAHEDRTVNDFVLECVRMRLYKCTHSHNPNKKTREALKNADEKKDLIHYSSMEEFLESLNK